MMTFIKPPAAVLARRSVTPTSFSKLQNISMVISGATTGKNRLTMTAIHRPEQVRCQFHGDKNLHWPVSATKIPG